MEINEQQRYVDFKISDCWIHAIMDRYNLSCRVATHRAQENNKESFVKTDTVIKHIIALNELSRKFEPQFILQMDETPTYIDMTAKRTVDQTGKKTIEKNHTGQRFTTVLTIAANGYRLPTYLILRKLSKPPAHLELNPNIIINVSDSGFMSSKILPHYIKNVIKPYIKESNCLLILDDFTVHKTENVIDYFSQNNIKHCIIPGGYTYCLQPLDVTINKPSKDELRKLWNHWNEKSKRYTKKEINRNQLGSRQYLCLTRHPKQLNKTILKIHFYIAVYFYQMIFLRSCKILTQI